MELTFINKEITEARMFRNRTIMSKLGIDDVANFAFLNTLLLYMLYSEYDTAPAAVGYADKTIRYNSFDNYRVSGSELYMAFHIVVHPHPELSIQMVYLHPSYPYSTLQIYPNR